MRRVPAILLLLLGCSKAAPPQAPSSQHGGEVWLSDDQFKQTKLKVEVVDLHPFASRIVTGGKIAFDDLRVTHVFSPVTGRVTKIFADLGQDVKKGDPLATIESPDLAQAYSDLLKAKADLVAAQHDLKRQQELAEAHAAPQAVLELSEDNFHKAEAELERADLKVKLLHAPGSTAVEQGFVLRAPIDGKVVGRNVNPGIEVQGMLSAANLVNELFTIGAIDKVWMLADLYEAQLGKVHRGDKVEISSVAYPKPSHGVVDYVSDVLDPTTRTARIRCVVDNPDGKLKPEMFVTANVTLGQRSVVSVPRNAVLKLSDQQVVFVQLGRSESGMQRFQVRPVKLGDDEGECPTEGDAGTGEPSCGLVEILNGLNTGDQLVTEGAILLSSQV